jgi:FAD:protein FMN transferase
VPASPVVRALVAAAVAAARATGGLVDATLVAEIEAAGYVASRAGECPAPLAEALAAAPPRRPARLAEATAASPPPGPARLADAFAAAPPLRPAGARRAPWWEAVEVGEASVTRPPGLRFDSGGLGKGLIADLVLPRERPLAFVDCGGDVAVGGADAPARPWHVAVRHPVEDAVAHRFTLARGGVASSGIARRLWLGAGGAPAHHLLDPSTGAPAWTGLLSATAVGRSAVEAETLAKAAYLGGPDGARRVLAAHGGLLVREDGDVEVIQARHRPAGAARAGGAAAPRVAAVVAGAARETAATRAVAARLAAAGRALRGAGGASQRVASSPVAVPHSANAASVIHHVPASLPAVSACTVLATSTTGVKRCA